jgi:diguanylate cyclase (GGDEF)-like protein
MHKLLSRQLKRRRVSDVWMEEGAKALSDIAQAYSDFDREKDLVERSLELVSEELNERNQVLKSKLIQLEETHLQLADSLSVLNSIFDSTGEAIVAFSQSGQLLRSNSFAANISKKKIFSKKFSMFKTLWRVTVLLKYPHRFSKQLKRLKMRPEGDVFGNLEFKTGEVFEYHSSSQMIGGKLHGRVWCFRNVTRIKANERLVQHQAYHDALTNLPNRLLLQDRLKQEISFAHRTQSIVAILFIDLDHFKKINDTLGHQQGDQLLIEVSRRIRHSIREADTLARLGGDEFVVVLGSLKSHSPATLMSQRIVTELQQHFDIEVKKYYISCSIGISLYPRDDENGEELIRKADLAMYHAKEQGRNDFQYFDDALERLAHYNLDLENRLRTALKKNQFQLYYQPKICLSGANIGGVEALLRWTVDGKNLISPTEFIPIAERMGLMVQLGYWVIEEVCRQIQIWKNDGIENINVAINLSAQQFSEENFVDRIKLLVGLYEVDPASIDWEITESILLEDLSQVKGVLEQLKEMGSSISIDDFGTGYSSLQYLQKLPVDTLKIDRSFIVELAQNPSDESLVSGIISLAHNLKLNVVAEGVEDEPMVKYLAARDCDFIQGYFYYKPMHQLEMTRVFKQER